MSVIGSASRSRYSGQAPTSGGSSLGGSSFSGQVPTMGGCGADRCGASGRPRAVVRGRGAGSAAGRAARLDQSGGDRGGGVRERGAAQALRGLRRVPGRAGGGSDRAAGDLGGGAAREGRRRDGGGKSAGGDGRAVRVGGG